MANSDYPQISSGAIASPALIPAQQLLRRGLPDKVPLLYALLGAGTPPYKMSPSDAAYQSSNAVTGQRCGNCVRSYQNVVSKRYICDQIRGDIRPEAWCRLWMGKPG